MRLQFVMVPGFSQALYVETVTSADLASSSSATHAPSPSPVARRMRCLEQPARVGKPDCQT